MKTEFFYINSIPAVLYGEAASRVWLFVHGKMGCKEEGAAFAEVVCPKGAQVLAIDLPAHGARQALGETLDPWTALPELRTAADYIKGRWGTFSFRANSIGAYFSLLALDGADKALLVSPILDMEGLILNMCRWSGVTEAQLEARGEIPTDFGETLSWRYLCFVRANPIPPRAYPICILSPGQDNMTPREATARFSAERGASLRIMEDGEHWFHTPAQCAVLRAWEEENT